MNKNYPVVLRSMICAGASMHCRSVCWCMVIPHEGIFLVLGLVFYISAIIQLILFKKKRIV